jgi:ankyrin repeat protein
MSKGGSLHPIRKKSQELLKAISDKVVVDAIEVALNSVVEASKIKTLTGLLKNPQNYRELFSQHPYNQIKALKQIASRDLILKEKAPDPTFKKSESELEDIFESNTKNKERDLSKGYGPGKLSALHLASWYKKQQPLDAVIQKMQEQNLPLEPKDLEGNTPLHRSLPNATIKLLAAKANANVKNKDLKTPWETNQYQESKTLIKQEGTKQKILKKVTNSREIEI